MTPTALRALLTRLRLSQLEAARRLGVGGRTMRRWCSPDGRPPKWVALALRGME
jgi:DNA-binding transcriptional regulator YiaG